MSARSSKKIILVSNDILVEFMLHVLEGMGYTFDRCLHQSELPDCLQGSGRDAEFVIVDTDSLRTTEERKTNVCLGPLIVREIRKHSPLIPILTFSREWDENREVEALHLPQVSVLSNPTPAVLAETVTGVQHIFS
jgi:hypothetical protein